MIKLFHNKRLDLYEYNNWEIEHLGGFITVSRWSVVDKNTPRSFWQPTKREAMALLEKIINDPKEYDKIPELYKKPLY